MKIRVKILILFIIVGAIAALAMNMGWLDSDDAPKEIKSKIEALGNEDFEITSVKDDGELYKIRLKLLEIPSDALVETWTVFVCKETHKILRNESISRDISVQVYADLMGGKRKEYGEAYYDLDRFSCSFK